MTVQVDEDGPNTETYRSGAFAVNVNGLNAYVYKFSRETNFAVPGWWSEEEAFDVPFVNFGTDQETTVTIALLGDIDVTSVNIYPRVYGIEATFVGNTATFALRPRQKVWVGFNGVNTFAIHVFANELMETPAGTVYNGTQTEATGTLIFPRGVHDLVNAGAWADIGFPVAPGALVYLEPGAVVIGNFDLNGGGATHSDDAIVDGPGVMSGEFITWEEVSVMDFAGQQAHSMLAGFVSGTLPSGITVRNITIALQPYYAFGITAVNNIHDVKILAPWAPNSDGIKPHQDRLTDAPGEASHCYVWGGDDACVVEFFQSDVNVSDSFLCSSGSACVLLGWQQLFVWPRSTTTMRNLYALACGDYYTTEDGTEGGAIIQAQVDAPYGSDGLGRFNVTIDGLYVDGAEMNSVLFWLGNRLYQWGTPKDAAGNLAGITIRNVVTEATPLERSKLRGLDARNTLNGLRLENIVTDGVRWSVRNAASFMTWDPEVFNVSIDGASLVA